MAARTTKTTTAKAKTTVKKVVAKTAPKTVESKLDPRVFGYQAKPALLSQVLHVYRDNTHQDTSKVLTRGELTKTTKKMFKQKGTGNARHGSRMSPTFVGGGVAHGPTGVQPANLKVNRKMKAAALAGLLSIYHQEKNVELVSLPQVAKPKLREFRSLLPKDKTVLVYGTEGTPVVASLKNLANVDLVSAAKLNAYDVANSRFVALTPSAHELLVSRLLPLLKTEKK